MMMMWVCLCAGVGVGNASADDDDDDGNVAGNSVADCHLSMRFAVSAFNCFNGYLGTLRCGGPTTTPLAHTPRPLAVSANSLYLC